MAVEGLLVSLGATISKALLKSWLGDGLAADVGGDLYSFAGGRITSAIERSRINRIFTRLSEDIAEKLQPFIDVEFRSLPANERNAAVLAVQDSITQADLSDPALFATDLDPTRL